MITQLDVFNKLNKLIQQIDFTDNLTKAGGTRMYSIIEEKKEAVLDFSKVTVKVL